MKPRFPADRAEKRDALLRAVESVREILAEGTDKGEQLRTLPPASIAALRNSGLFLLKAPAVLGGAEADLVTQLDVIEAVSYIDAAAGWCLFICADIVGMSGAFLSDAAVAQLFSNDRGPTMAAAIKPGTAVRVPGGYKLTGRWSWGSGVRHAEWIGAQVVVTRDGVDSAEARFCVFPAAKAQIHDNWHVMGMKGTGSCDFSVSELFVPEEFTWATGTSLPRRGGPQYRLGFPGYVVNDHAGFALGVGRRALDTVIELAQSKRRGYGKQTALADRAVFQRSIAEGDLRLRAARALMVEVLEKAWTTVYGGRSAELALQIEMRSAAALVTDVALEVATSAFRYGGGTAVFLQHSLQRCFRDLSVAASHLVVSDSAYEHYGQSLLGLEVNQPGW